MSVYQSAKDWRLFPKFYIFIVMHGLAVAGLILYPLTWPLFALFLATSFVTACLGICISYHRNLTHRAFRFKHKNLERVFATLGDLALQQGPIWWVSIHRIHHRYSDSDEDPHNNKRGFFYSHFLWLFRLDPQWSRPDKVERYQDKAKDISSDPYYLWLDKHYYIPPLAFLALLYAAGGWAWVFWGGFIRTVYVWHVTWFVNSLTHRYGYQSFDSAPADSSTNNWLVGLLAYGEGWHNNHHAFPSSAKQGFFRWWEFDLSYLIILGMEKLGLVDNLNQVPVSTLEARRHRDLAAAH